MYRIIGLESCDVEDDVLQIPFPINCRKIVQYFRHPSSLLHSGDQGFNILNKDITAVNDE